MGEQRAHYCDANNESHGYQRASERLSHRHASLVSACGSSSGGSGAIAGNDVGLVTTNRGQWASPDEFSITVGERYVCEKNREFSVPNRTIVIWASKSGGFRENREGWQPCVRLPQVAIHSQLPHFLV